MSDETGRALDIARGLVAAGVPVFVAPPCPTDCRRKGHEGGKGTGGSGFDLPPKWETTTTKGNQVDRWQPGWALCAVMGHVMDLADADPRNGSDATVAGLKAAGAWPRSYGRAATPSGGTHDFIAPLGTGSRDAVAAGLDVKSGQPDGEGRGFAFIAPTVKVSKVTGQLEPYRWLVEPDLDALAEGGDDTGATLAAMVAAARGTRKAASTGDFWDQFDQGQAYTGPVPDGKRFAAMRSYAGHLRASLPALTRVEYELLCWRRWKDCAQPPAAVYEWTWDEAQANPVRDIWDRYPAGTGQDTAVAEEPEKLSPRRVDLTPWLDGSYVAPEPERGAIRDDGRLLLYPGRWHTCIGPNESGKSMLGVAHTRDEILNARRTVVYLHFEEVDPGGTVARLLALGVPAEVIRERFVWLSCDRSWLAGELTAELEGLDPGLVILDGINAACSRHGQDVEKTTSVGWYRATLVTPAARLGAAVLSLGHPVKAKDRQDERHGFGSTAWLDEVDGVGFRLTASKTTPIRRGGSGAASLHVVKDRYGSVTQLGQPDNREGWTYVGSLVVDDTGSGTSVRLSTPTVVEVPAGGDDIDRLADDITAALTTQGKQRYDSERQLTTLLRAARVTFNDHDLGPALERMAWTGRLDRDEYKPRKPRGGWLIPAVQDQED